MTRITEPGFPKLEKQTRPWKCKRGLPEHVCSRTKPCVACRNRRNRNKGKRGQHANRRVIEDVTGVQASWRGKLANEETADHLPVRYENKAGRAGGANTVATHYLKAEAQAEAAKRIGDNRPFIATFSPDGMSDGLFVIRASQFAAVIEACVMSEPIGSKAAD